MALSLCGTFAVQYDHVLSTTERADNYECRLPELALLPSVALEVSDVQLGQGVQIAI